VQVGQLSEPRVPIWSGGGDLAKEHASRRARCDDHAGCGSSIVLRSDPADELACANGHVRREARAHARGYTNELPEVDAYKPPRPFSNESAACEPR